MWAINSTDSPPSLPPNTHSHMSNQRFGVPAFASAFVYHLNCRIIYASPLPNPLPLYNKPENITAQSLPHDWYTALCSMVEHQQHTTPSSPSPPRHATLNPGIRRIWWFAHVSDSGDAVAGNLRCGSAIAELDGCDFYPAPERQRAHTHTRTVALLEEGNKWCEKYKILTRRTFIHNICIVTDVYNSLKIQISL